MVFSRHTLWESQSLKTICPKVAATFANYPCLLKSSDQWTVIACEQTSMELVIVPELDSLITCYRNSYYIVRNFRGVQFSQMIDLYHFVGFNFVDVHTHAHFVLYNQAYFTGLIFTVRIIRKNWTPRLFPTIQYCQHSVCL